MEQDKPQEDDVAITELMEMFEAGFTAKLAQSHLKRAPIWFWGQGRVYVRDDVNWSFNGFRKGFVTGRMFQLDAALQSLSGLGGEWSEAANSARAIMEKWGKR